MGVRRHTIVNRRNYSSLRDGDGIEDLPFEGTELVNVKLAVCHDFFT
jgi:hypothetical protein